jgi:predicted peroxiredoxin
MAASSQPPRAGGTLWAAHYERGEHGKRERIDIHPVGEFLTMIHEAGCEIYACRATVVMFYLKPEDFCAEVDGVISVGQFYEKAAGAQIIFT